MEPDKIAFLQTIFPFIAIMAALGIGGWVLTTWLRIKNGYPLNGSRGPGRVKGEGFSLMITVSQEIDALRLTKN